MAFPGFQPDAFQNEPTHDTPGFQVAVVVNGGGAAMVDRTYYEALRHWMRTGRQKPMSETERLFLERARIRQEQEDELILLQ